MGPGLALGSAHDSPFTDDFVHAGESRGASFLYFVSETVLMVFVKATG